MRLRQVLAVVLCMALLLGGCSFRTKYGDTFRFPLEGEPEQLDPQMAADTASVTVLRSLMEGLTVLDDNGEPQAAVAGSWSVSDGNKRWVFTLRECSWSNGTPVTAADFVFAWERAVAETTGSPLKECFENIASATATDARTLTVVLKAGDAAFAALVADTPFFPCNETFFNETQGHYGMDAEYVLSNGAFTLAAWEHHSDVSMRRNETYYAVKSIAPEAVRYVITDVADPVTALDEDNLDAAELTAAQAAAAQQKGLPVVSMTDSLYAMWFNTSVEALSGAEVRTALRDSVEWELLKEPLALRDVAAGQVDFVPPDAVLNGTGYRETAGTVGSTATEQATARLKAADLPVLTVLCGEDEESLQVARLIVQSWQKHADLYFSLKPLSAEELSAHIAVGNYEIAIGAVAGQSADARELLSAYVSDGANNVTRLQDDTLAGMLAAADSADDLVACEKRLHELCPCVPLWYAERAYGTAKGVSGLVIRSFLGNPYGSVYDFRCAEK